MSLRKLFSPHRYAAELFDRKIDGEDVAELDAHLDRCAECRASFETKKRTVEALRGLGTAKAPTGFAGRVMLAARARGRAEVPREDVNAMRPRFWRMVPMQQLAAGAFAVLLVAGIAVVGTSDKSSGTKPNNGVSALAPGGALPEKAEHAHFVVRAPGIGAAKARSQITAIVQGHRGTFSEQGDAIVAHLPRTELIAMTQDLANRGRFKMTKAEDLAPEAQEIIIRFEIE